MSKLIKKINFVILGIIILHCGVSLTMVADIGIGGYDAFGVTISYIVNISVGIIYILMSLVCFLIQVVVERKNFKLKELFQLLFVFGSGLVVDFFSQYLFGGIIINSYALKVAVFAGAVIMKSFGIMLIMETYLMRIPLEGVCFLISQRSKLSLGKVRLLFDVAFLLAVAALSLTLKLPFTIGVGTIIAIVLQGPMMDVFKKPIDRLYGKLNMLDEIATD